MSSLVTAKEAEGQVASISSSFSIFLLFAIIISFFATALFAANTAFYVELRKAGCGSTLSTSQADTLFWVNFIGAIISGITALIGIFYLFIAQSKPKWVQTYVGSQGTLTEQLETTQRREQIIKSEIAQSAAQQQAAREMAFAQSEALRQRQVESILTS